MARPKKQEKEMINANLLLDKIIGATFTRHASLSEEEFLKEIQASEGDSEDVAVIKARYTLINSCTRELLKANDTIKMINATLNLCFDEKKEK